MVSGKVSEEERKRIATCLRIVSQINTRSLEEIMKISKLMREAYSRQTIEQWQLVQQMQLTTVKHLAEANMVAISKTLADMQKLGLQNIMSAVEASSSAYQDYLKYVQQLLQESILLEAIQSSKMLSLAYANTILSYRTLIEPISRIKIQISNEQSQLQEKVEQDVEVLLAEVDPNFVTMRKGAWNAFNAKGPDYLRQSISSMRELLNHVLRSLSPEGPTRKDRIREIVSGNRKTTAEVVFIESIADYVDKLYAVLSKVAHTIYEDELYVELALKSTDAILVVVLEKGVKRMHN